MTKAKFGFVSYLEEFDGSGFGNAFSANVLGNSQLTQDSQQGDDEEENNNKKEARLRKEIEDSLNDETNNDDSLVDSKDKEPNDNNVLKHLKNLLFRMPGAEDLDLDDDASSINGGPEPDSGTDAAGHIFNAGKELISNGQPIKQSSYAKFDDPTNPRKMADSTYTTQGSTPDEDNHDQLIAAIKELRDELRKSRGSDNQAIEQEEDIAEEDESDDTQYANAGKMFQTLVNQKMNRAKIIAAFEKNLGVTNSTAVSYYQRLAKNAGLTNSGDRTMNTQPPGLGVPAGFENQTTIPGGQQPSTVPQESNISGVEIQGDPNRQGLIRTVKGAHLVYKRKNEEGTFDELWVFGTGGDMENSLKVRRAILAGTDIPARATKSVNGNQSYTLKTLGNGQLLSIKGLQN